MLKAISSNIFVQAANACTAMHHALWSLQKTWKASANYLNLVQLN